MYSLNVSERSAFSGWHYFSFTPHTAFDSLAAAVDSIASVPDTRASLADLVAIGHDSSATQKAFIPTDSIKVGLDASELLDIAAKKKGTKGSTKGKDSLAVRDTTALVKLFTSRQRDSLQALKDLAKLDSMKLDSTARLAYFKLRPVDQPSASVASKRPSHFLANPTQRKKIIEIDSTGKYVVIKEKIGDQSVRQAIKLPIDDYIAMKIKSRRREMWEDIVNKYELKDGKKDLNALIRNITDFEIPLPSVGVLSIFGAPKISLHIGGAVDIHGAWRNETTEGITASSLGNTRNEPDFRQQVQINVNGTIGDKLQISADWNTERTFEYENQLKIKYTGYEDEIVQSVEAGNVSLQTSSLVGGSEALFGVKANFKMGPLNLTALASQKKGEVKEKSISGGASSSTFSKRVYEYSRNNYFIDTVYADTSSQNNIFFKYYGTPDHAVPNYTVVKNWEVWKSISVPTNNPNERNAIAYINLPDRPLLQPVYPDSMRAESIQEIEGKVVKGRFIKLTNNVDYIMHERTGYITFKTNIDDNDIIAIAYSFDGPTTASDDDRYVGELLDPNNKQDTKKTLVLKLVKPRNLQPQDTTAWKLLLKNIYPTGTMGVQKEGFQFDIKYEISGSDPQIMINDVKLLNAFGLDSYDQSESYKSDGIFDYKENITIIPETGEIIFPRLQPFGGNFPATLPDSLKYTDVYTTTVTFAQYNKLRDKFVLTGKSQGTSSNRMSLGYNLVENSVKVTLDGRELVAGSDYTMDYNTGELYIRNAAALSPGANLKVSYEENDLFQIASKTLFGLRGMIDIARNTKLGFSLLTLSQQTLSDKVRIGEEPLSNTIYGVDFTTSHNLPFLTSAIDKVFSTKEMSTFTFSGEFAAMNPNPNTKTSTVQSDNSKNVAYIDDFEGSKRIIPVGISYTAWKDLSVPILPDSSVNVLSDSAKMSYKGKAWWFNVLPSNVNVNSIWPKKRVSSSDQAVTVLDFAFRPDEPGPYNYFPRLSENKQKNWGGMMKLLSTTASNLIEQNIEYIEFWVKPDNNIPAGTKLTIDLGKISEDVIPNHKLDSEDKNNNQLIDEGEDTGLDGMNDAAERAVYGDSQDDPAHDDFHFSRTTSTSSSDYNIDDYKNINGTEGNAQLTDVGRFPDTEDLNHNGALDEANSYFRYEVPLDISAVSNPYIAGGGDNDGWYLMRVPLKDFKAAIGQPSLSVVEMIRVFVTGASDLIHFRLAEFNLVGNQWQKLVQNDPRLDLSVVSIEDNPDYNSPDGVQREKDRTNPNQEVLKNEQSLNMMFNNIPVDSTHEAVKYLSRPLDVFNYHEMKLFIHSPSNSGPTSIGYYKDTSEYNSDVFFRFGSDTNNYYEYQQPLQGNLAGGNWSEMDIAFSELTALKQARDSVKQIFKVPVAGKPGHYYVVKGNPTLTSIQFMSIGLYHRRNINPALQLPTSGDVWVDELRVIGADDTKGYAYTASASLKFADFMTINFNYSHQDPFFHRLADRFGSRVESNSWGFSADFDLLKLLPISGQDNNLRVNYARNESMGKPLYQPGTDIKVSEAKTLLYDKLISQNVSEADARKQVNDLETNSQTLNISETWTVANIKLKIPTNYWLVRDTWNSLSFSFNYNKTFGRNPTTLESRSWVWNASMNYGLNISPDYSFYPYTIPVIGKLLGLTDDYKALKVYYLPQTINYNISAHRTRTYNTTRPTETTPANLTTSRDFSTSRGLTSTWKMSENGFLNLSMNYSFSGASTLTYLETENDRQNTEGWIWRQIFSGVFLGKDINFTQNIDIKSNPRVPSFWDLNKYITLTAGYSVAYVWNNALSQPVLGRSIGFRNSSSLGLNIRLKGLLDPLFKEDAPQAQLNSQVQSGAIPVPDMTRRPDIEATQGAQNTANNPAQPVSQEGALNQAAVPNQQAVAGVDSSRLAANAQIKKDSLGVKRDSVVQKSKLRIDKSALIALKVLSKILLADYESIQINFTNTNTYSNSGIAGTGNGLKNFWDVTYKSDRGPSRWYMFGLSSDPGPRAPGGSLNDNFAQQNNIDFRTSKPLWDGARMDITWKVGWSINKSTTLQTDSLGFSTVSNIISNGSISRSFLSLPAVFPFSIFKSGIKRVNEIYSASANQDQASLSAAFLQGFETFPWLSKLPILKDIGNYIPRPNWRITWDGLEKLPFLKNYTKKVSLEHSYSSDYTEGWKITDGASSTQSQKITVGFQPLLGLNMTFNDLWSGNFTGSVKYSLRSGYDLGISTKNISQDYSKEIGITLNYAKSGFEVPLFGISLKNDIEFSVSYSSTHNTSILYDMTQFTEAGVPQNGTIRTTLNPTIKYVISSRVTMSVFYKRSKTEPEGTSQIPSTTVNEAGLDIRISIQ
jgi:cell surface protein SprA